jgi:hypothetical protein
MDCFLASSLGRPNLISCASASDFCPFTPDSGSNGVIALEGNELRFSVNASKIIGDILARVYHKRKASRSIAFALSLQFSNWIKELPNDLHWRHISIPNEDHELTLKRLHINMVYFHGVLLLMRPFLLHEISMKLEETRRDSSSCNLGQRNRASSANKGRPEQAFCFHGACVRSAMHTITAVYAVYQASALPRRDPFIMHVLPPLSSASIFRD